MLIVQWMNILRVYNLVRATLTMTQAKYFSERSTCANKADIMPYRCQVALPKSDLVLPSRVVVLHPTVQQVRGCILPRHHLHSHMQCVTLPSQLMAIATQSFHSIMLSYLSAVPFRLPHRIHCRQAHCCCNYLRSHSQRCS